MVKHVVAAAVLVLCWTMLAAGTAYGQPPEPQDEFKPVGNAPAGEQIPAAPLLIGAYVIVLAGLFTYVFTLSRRLGTVQRDVERLEADVRRKGRA
jgi:hypothetical protein